MYIGLYKIISGIPGNLCRNLLFFLVLIFNCSNSFTQVKSIRLGHLSIEQGLSQSTVLTIAQDSSGFLWFGTQDGLNRYDGYNFVVYKPIPDDSSSLSDNYIYCIYVDKYGNVWSGTDDGLNKYNPETGSFTSYKNNPDDPKSISSNRISSITGDSLGNLWIGTINGLNYFESSKNKFINYFHNDKNKSSLLSNFVISIFVDSQNRFWAGTDKGLDLFNPKTKTFRHFIHYSNEKNSILGQKINSITQDKLGNLWIGTFSGLNKLNVQSNIFIHFIHSITDKKSINSDSISVVYVDKKGIVWIGTKNNGLSYYDPVNKAFIEFGNSVVNSNEAGDKQIRCLLEDREGLLWIGTFTSGIYKYDNMKKSFGLIMIDDKLGNKMEENDISAIYKDNLNNLWVGSFYDGIIKVNEKTGKFTQYLHTKSENSLTQNFINAIFVDQKGFIWFGTTEGLDKFNANTNTFYHFKHEVNNNNNLGSDYISSITSDKAGNIWLGLNGSGMDKFDPSTKNFTHYIHNPDNSNSISDNNINYLFFDNRGILWIGTNGNGLDRFDTKTERFKHFVHEANNNNSLCNNIILDIYQFPGDTSGTIWITSAGGGFSRLNTKKMDFINYNEKDGLANNEVYSALGDKKGNLWLSTNNGLSKFNIAAQRFHNYNQSDGLQSNEFNQGAFFQSNNGKMYFGGKSGINSFFPDSIKYNLYNPQVVFTSFKDYNGQIKLKKSIWKTNQIRLSYKDNIISFTFSALSYTDPNKNKFAYMLKGLNNKWIDKGTNNEVTFTNLSPGKYTLLVKGTNNDGVWSSHIAAINIIILPPFWETVWFRVIALIFLAAILFIISQLRVRAIRLRNKKLEEVVTERTKELNSKKEELEDVNFKQAVLVEKLTKSEIELKGLNKHKDKILSVLAHDLRSPFTGLLGFTDLLSNNIDQLETEEIKQSAKNINNVTNNLYKLLNNLLEWSLVQEGKIKYSPSNENLLHCVNESISLLKANAEHKSISLKINIENNINVWADRNMLDIIFRNLISNALKFTPVGGEVNIYSKDLDNQLSIDIEKTNNKFVEIVIQDNGVGIEKEMLSGLLSPDSQITTKGTNNEAGTGLGLSLSKELIEMQRGKIRIVSKEGEGTSVIFTLPKYKSS